MSSLKRLNNKRGFTLIEMIVSMAILGIIMIGIISFFQFGNVMNVKDNEQYIIQSDARLDIDKIISEIKYANEIYLVDVKPTASEQVSSTYSYVYIDNGKVFISIYVQENGSRINTILKGTYIGSESNFSKDVVSTDSLIIQLSSQYNSQTYKVDSTIKLQNLNLSSPASSVQGSTTSQVIKFKVPSED